MIGGWSLAGRSSARRVGSKVVSGATGLTGLQRHRRSIRQFVKFGIVGGSGVVVNMLVTIAMHKAHGGTANGRAPLFAIPGTPYYARYLHLVWIVAFLVANVWNFQLNRGWTFRSRGHSTWWRQFWPFLAVGSATAVVGLFVITALTHPQSPIYLPDPYFNELAGLRSRFYWAQLITIVVTMPINFLANKLWTFRAVRHHAPRSRSHGSADPLERADGDTAIGAQRGEQ